MCLFPILQISKGREAWAATSAILIVCIYVLDFQVDLGLFPFFVLASLCFNPFHWATLTVRIWAASWVEVNILKLISVTGDLQYTTLRGCRKQESTLPPELLHGIYVPPCHMHRALCIICLKVKSFKYQVKISKEIYAV